MQYTSLSYSKQSYLGEGPRNAAIRTSLDGFTADVDSIAGLDPGGIEQLQFDLTSLTPTASPLEFRVYFFNTPSTGLDWADLLSTGAGFTGLILKGDAVAVGGTTSFLNNGDGLSSGSIAIIAGGIAAVVAIVAGGWYTRRRWLGSRS